MKHATRRAPGEVRHLTRDGIEFGDVAIETRQTGHQPDCVGMARVVEDRSDRSLLHHAAAIHHGHAVGGFRDQSEIMRDQDHRGAGLLAHARKHLHHLRLDRHIERRGRLVGNQQIRIVGHRDGDHHALAHAAGEFVRILLVAPFGIGNADQVEQLDDARMDLRARPRDVMQPDGFGDLRADPQDRVQGRHRVLEHHRHRLAADRAHLLEATAASGRARARSLRLRSAAPDRAIVPSPRASSGSCRSRIRRPARIPHADRRRTTRRRPDASFRIRTGTSITRLRADRIGSPAFRDSCARPDIEAIVTAPSQSRPTCRFRP